MAFVAAKNTAFKLDNAAGTLTDISTYIDSVGGIANTTDMAETTTFGATSKTFQGTLRNGDTISISGKWDSALNTQLVALLGLATSSTFEYHPAGTTAGLPKVSGECFVASYEVSSAVADLVTFSASLQITGAVTWGTN
jgi:hypothetical protein